MLAAFAIFGFLVLGEFFFEYKNLYLALLTNIRMVSGDLRLSDYLANDSVSGIFYYLVFVVNSFFIFNINKNILKLINIV